MFDVTLGTYSCKKCWRSEEHTSELQSRSDLVCRLLLEKKKNDIRHDYSLKANRRASRPEPSPNSTPMRPIERIVTLTLGTACVVVCILPSWTLMEPRTL